MRELYDRLLEEGEAGIDRLIAERTQESLQLDFKRKEVGRNGEFSPNDRKILAEALSGFANSAGGLLIIGVDARKGADGIDCAQAARPIVDIRRFLADTNTEIGRLVQPRLDGVTLAAIESDRDPGSGYLLVHVERSERRPHRSEAKAQKGYFKRVGDSFFEMEHYDIEDAFSRITSPVLDLNYVITHRFRSGQECEFDLKLFLHNTSEYIAKFPYIIFHSCGGCLVPRASTTDQPLDVQVGRKVISLSGGADSVIQPGAERHVATLRVQFLFLDNNWLLRGAKDKNTVYYDASFGCEGGRTRRQQMRLDRIEFPLLA